MASHRRGKRLTHFEVVNRWCLDFYVAEALNAFRDDEYTRFTHIRDHLQSLLEMPIEANSSLPMKLLVMQFLSRIYDGDKLGTKFEESEDSVTPLESAMTVLENICAELEVPQSDLERFHTSLREMVVIVCIKSKEFKKAKEMLQKHFPTRKTPIGKAKLLSDLVQRKCSTHPTLEQLSYSQFRQNTLDFIERVYTMPQPFLSMVAGKKNGVVEESQVIKRRSKRLENGTQTVNHTEHTPAPRQEQDTPEHRSSASSGFVTLRVLRKVYETQAKREGLKMPFSRLMEEVYKEAPQEEQKEVQGGEEEQQQEQQEEEEQEEEEILCKGVTRKETNQNENVQEKTLGGEEVHKESKLGEVTEKEAQEEDNGEETQDEEESVAGSLHLYLSETPLEISEREEVVALWEEEEEAAMEVEEEEQQQESEPDREKDTGEAVRPVPPPLSPAPEKAAVEQHHRALESDGGKDAGEGDAPVPAVSPPPLSSEESIEEQQESEPDRDKEEIGKGKEEEEEESESILDREKDRSEEDVVVPTVSPPPLSPGHTDHLFSQTDSPSLLAPRRARSRHKNSLLTAPDDGPDSPLHPHSPESESRDPAEQAKSAVNSLPGGLPVSKNRFARYCRVTVAQLVMLPDSQTWTCPSQNSDLKRSAADSTSATEDSLLDDPILPSHTDTKAEKTVGTRPLALALRRLRDPTP
ncbi:telomeric repeat binding factor a [Clupea harengus]|uniref:Telomeric repeat binding factor a n=1 Tax=Clupea harengus TaxID=7950 RepID=A0A6P3VEW4_CLUHA|nr:telomeric repeat binding factor a [Clupea harengus]